MRVDDLAERIRSFKEELHSSPTRERAMVLFVTSRRPLIDELRIPEHDRSISGAVVREEARSQRELFGKLVKDALRKEGLEKLFADIEVKYTAVLRESVQVAGTGLSNLQRLEQETELFSALGYYV